ncbi:hypothetical protein R2A130_0040 [Ahrensia sp. R2A130]|nr:hypothetical protein R2A130_0040 [Ahrensia sp. R2A130]
MIDANVNALATLVQFVTFRPKLEQSAAKKGGTLQGGA